MAAKEKSNLTEAVSNSKNKDMRVVKLYAGMTPEYEIIRTDAPDSVIETHLTIINTLEEEGLTVGDPYEYILKSGYIVEMVGFHEDDVKYDYDISFDYYDYKADMESLKLLIEVRTQSELQAGLVKEETNLKERSYTVEVFKENNSDFVFISADGSSGCKYRVDSEEDIGKHVADYIGAYECGSSSGTSAKQVVTGGKNTFTTGNDERDKLLKRLEKLTYLYAEELVAQRKEYDAFKAKCEEAEKNQDSQVFLIDTSYNNCKVVMDAIQEAIEMRTFVRDTENIIEEWEIDGANALFDACNRLHIIPFDLAASIKGLLLADKKLFVCAVPEKEHENTKEVNEDE